MAKKMEELLDKIPAEKRWALTAKILLTISVLRGVKTVMPILGTEEGFISPVRGLEKFQEITDKIVAESTKRSIPRFKEMFNISVEDASGAFKLWNVWGELAFGPEWEREIVEATPERVVARWTKCPWMERYKEYKVAPEFIVCPSNHQTGAKEGLKAITPKLNYKLIKAMPWGDPYCEAVIEFKEERRVDNSRR